MARFAGLWLPVLAFMAGVWFLSDHVSIDAPELWSDKAAHFVAYGLFGLANMRAFHGGLRRPEIWAALAALGLTAGYGALDEWRQAGVEHRVASWGDWVADAAGGAAAWAVLKVYPFRDRGLAREGEG